MDRVPISRRAADLAHTLEDGAQFASAAVEEDRLLVLALVPLERLHLVHQAVYGPQGIPAPGPAIDADDPETADGWHPYGERPS